MQKLRNKFLLLGLNIFFLSACTNLMTVKRATEADWQSSDNQLNADFDSSGRLSVIDDGKGSYANFSWQSLGRVQTIEVNTPLGNSVGVLCRDTQGVIAEDNHGQITTATSVEELSQQMLGFSLPFDHLNQWIQGYWIAYEPHKILANGSLQQSGWIIHREILKDSNTPRMVRLNNNRFEIKLIFDDFSQSGTDDIASQCELRQKLS